MDRDRQQRRNDRRPVITDDIQRHATEAHLRQFAEAAANLEVRYRNAPSSINRLELVAVRAMVEDLESQLTAGLVTGPDLER